ncbi:MAG TPA: carboxy-S-adenosyl-L-methionine synthase CmoA [Gammaproteobacteria bacterium]|nr:carboxy-S-adenosyl-L-methionine synthase CmoA [Gammaproteobacteria bacterium]HET7587963.1 carboxy-S-adenosyl-L-methionine synthase CmoA [Gammaproteobacteria bacterium]
MKESDKPANPSTSDNDAAVDRVFAEEQTASDFAFDNRTAAVFDDMVSRSVPFYEEMQRMTAELAADFAVKGTNLFDLGCSTATTMLYLDPLLDQSVRFVGVDNSKEMLDRAAEKLEEKKIKRPYELKHADLHHDTVVENASVVIMLLSLQFMRPLYRERVMRRIYDGMIENSALILIEKLTVGDSLINRLFIRHYYDLKRRRHYSEMEISQKREALENVLIPYRYEENRDLLLDAGFRHVEAFFRWYNFCGMVAVK